MFRDPSVERHLPLRALSSDPSQHSLSVVPVGVERLGQVEVTGPLFEVVVENVLELLLLGVELLGCLISGHVPCGDDEASDPSENCDKGENGGAGVGADLGDRGR